MAEEATIRDGMTVGEAFDLSVSKHADLEALVFKDEHISFREYGIEADALAVALMRLGLRRGEKVALILQNSLEYTYAFFAIPKAGGAIVPINPLYRPGEMRHILADSEAAMAIVRPTVWGNPVLEGLRSVRDQLPNLREIIVDGDDVPEGMHSLKALVAATRGEAPETRGEPDDLWGLIYTSGTTGRPKGAMHTHRTMLASVIATEKLRKAMFERPSVTKLARMAKTMARYAGRFARLGGKQQKIATPSPFHALAGFGAMYNCAMSGFSCAIIERFHPVRVLEIVAKEQVTVLSGTPTMFSLMMSVPNFDAYAKSSLLYCAMGAAPCPPPLVKEVRKRFGCPVLISFGATETGGATTVTRMDDSSRMQTESVGQVVSDTEVKVVDDNHREVPHGQVGELACRAAGIMKGYYHSEEATASALDEDGWYYTGDLAVMDAKGYVRIVGRKKDMIIRGGQNIYPIEIESHLLKHPDIQSVAVVGVPDKVGGEAVWAYVVPKPGASVTPRDVLTYCRGKLTSFKVPSQVRLIDELPLTPTAKIQKYRLREMAIRELEEQGIEVYGKEFVIAAGRN